MNSQVKQGYKQTELGVIPEDWQIFKIGDIALKVGSGITPTGGSSRYKKEGRPFIRSQNVGWGKILYEDLAFIDEETHQSFPSTELIENDVLLNITGASIGRSTIIDKSLSGGNVNQHVCIIRSPQEVISSKFLNCFLLSILGQKQIDSFQAGGNRQGLNFGQIKSIQLALPPIAEQEKIAEALSDVDFLIESLEELIAKKRNIKQGAMQELLTGKRRLIEFEQNSGYKQTELGLIPKDWIEFTIGDLIEFKGGSQPDKNHFRVMWKPGYIRLIQIRDYKTDKYQTFIPENLARRFCNEKDIMIGRYGPPIFQILRGIKGAYNVALIKAKPKENMNYEYAYHYLKQTRLFAFIEKLSQRSSGQTGVDLEELKKYLLPLPPTKAEQEAIAEVLTDMDNEITALEEKLQKTRHLKQGMMQELLTGKTRLI